MHCLENARQRGGSSSQDVTFAVLFWLSEEAIVLWLHLLGNLGTGLLAECLRLGDCESSVLEAWRLLLLQVEIGLPPVDLRSENVCKILRLWAVRILISKWNLTISLCFNCQTVSSIHRLRRFFSLWGLRLGLSVGRLLHLVFVHLLIELFAPVLEIIIKHLLPSRFLGYLRNRKLWGLRLRLVSWATTLWRWRFTVIEVFRAYGNELLQIVDRRQSRLVNFFLRWRIGVYFVDSVQLGSLNLFKLPSLLFLNLSLASLDDCFINLLFLFHSPEHLPHDCVPCQNHISSSDNDHLN